MKCIDVEKHRLCINLPMLLNLIFDDVLRYGSMNVLLRAYGETNSSASGYQSAIKIERKEIIIVIQLFSFLRSIVNNLFVK